MDLVLVKNFPNVTLAEMAQKSLEAERIAINALALLVEAHGEI